jgi:transmembrane sensor
MAETEKHIESIDELIIKYLSGNSTSIEENEILSWVSRDLKNRKHFQQITDIWNISSLPAHKKKIDTRQAFIEFKKNLNKIRNNKIVIMVYSSAAAILLLISFLVLQNYKFDKRNLIADNTLITGTLPDGSEVCLNKHSSLLYYHPKMKRKRCAVIDGEVYFNVKQDSTNPFLVISDNIVIRVTGTSFNVKSSENVLEISLVEGSVSVDYNDTAKTFNLKAGESILVNKKLRTIENHQPMDINNLTWKTNELVFKNTDLKDVLSRLEKIYNITFQYDPSTIRSLKFDGRLSTDDLNVIIGTIEITFNLNFIPEGEKKYSVRSNN